MHDLFDSNHVFSPSLSTSQLEAILKNLNFLLLNPQFGNRFVQSDLLEI